MINNSISFSLIALLVAQNVAGHGQMTFPEVRADLVGRTFAHSQNQPLFTTLLGAVPNQYGNPKFTKESFRCRSYPNKSSNRQTLRAGEDFTFTFELVADHPGDCSLYLSDPAQEGQLNPSRWFKIYDLPGCGSKGGKDFEPPKNVPISRTFKVPEGVPACQDCVLRWEWYTVQQQSNRNIEYYANCADVKVENNLGTGKVERGMVSIGVKSAYEHLPQNFQSYRNPYGPNFEEFMVGPPIATFSLTTDNPNPSTSTTTITTTTTKTEPSNDLDQIPRIDNRIPSTKFMVGPPIATFSLSTDNQIPSIDNRIPST
eukprot:Pgem_evm1s11686